MIQPTQVIPANRFGLAVTMLCSLGVGVAPAERIVRDLDKTLGVGETFLLDLNNDRIDDFQFEDNGAGTVILEAVSSGAAILIDSATPFPPFPAVYSRGDRIELPAEEITAGQDFTFGIAALTGIFGAPFSEMGDTGFIGVTVASPDGGGATSIGFLEITRGSVIIGQVGYETAPSTPVTIPIPEPAAAAIATLGMGLILGHRRRPRSRCRR